MDVCVCVCVCVSGETLSQIWAVLSLSHSLNLSVLQCEYVRASACVCVCVKRCCVAAFSLLLAPESGESV